MTCEYPDGCCHTCDGKGTSNDPQTSGKCWDCYGTGHTHELEETMTNWETTDKVITIIVKKDGNVMMYVDEENGSGGGIATKEQIHNEIDISVNIQGGVITAEQINRAIGRSIQQSSRFR